MDEAGWVQAGPSDGGEAWRFGGAWTLAHAQSLDQAAGRLGAGRSDLVLDLSEVATLDTVGAWLIVRAAERAGEAGAKVAWIDPPETLRPLFRRVLEAGPEPEPHPERR